MTARAQGGGAVRHLLLRTASRLALLATVIYVPVCVAAPFLFQWVFGREWQVSGWLMLLLLPMWWAAAVVSPVSRLLVVMDRPAPQVRLRLSCSCWRRSRRCLRCGTGALNAAVFGYGMAACAAYVVYAALLLMASSDGRPAGPKIG